MFELVFAALHLAAIGLLIAMLVRPELRRGFERRCVGAATAEDLAYVRIVACAVMLVYVLTEDLGSYARFGPDLMTGPGLAARIEPLLDWFLASEARCDALTALVLVLTALGLVGAGTRVVLPLLVVVYFVYAALLRSCGKPFHEGYLIWYLLIVLCFLPSNDAWSVDARWLRRREAPKDTAYGWAVWACFAAASMPYLQLAFSKLSFGGPYWFEGRSLRNYVLTDNLNLTGRGLDLGLAAYQAPAFLWTIAALIGLVTELLYPLVLFVPRARLFLASAVIALHLGIWLGQNALFVDAVMVPAIFFLPSILRGRRA